MLAGLNVDATGPIEELGRAMDREREALAEWLRAYREARSEERLARRADAEQAKLQAKEDHIAPLLAAGVSRKDAEADYREHLIKAAKAEGERARAEHGRARSRAVEPWPDTSISTSSQQRYAATP
jgi:hypothetical protein